MDINENINLCEDYVSFQIAKLLKEKGFDEYTGRCFVGEEWESPSPLTNSQLPDGRYSRPTLQMAMKWLREIYHIHITIYPYGEYSCDNYQFDVYKNNNFVVSKDDGYVTYEQACEVAIKYCLENLI